MIKKYGLYDYRVVQVTQGQEHVVGTPNVYGVVASDLVDKMFEEISASQTAKEKNK